MMEAASAHWLPDGRRLHLHHGPIDLIIEAFGRPDEISAAYGQAVKRFQTILTELVDELPELRLPSSLRGARPFVGPTARRMENATMPLAENFITPMAAVAGSVADEMIAAMVSGRTLDRAYVNNGGDIALHLAPGQELTLAIAGTGHGFADRIVVRDADPVRGIATSGWRGRSFSLGIADAVTVLARTGAEADAAATIIANAVDLPGHPAIRRQPARDLAPDSDLGERPVTVEVRTLRAEEVAKALERGHLVAEELRRRELIAAAALFLEGDVRVAGEVRAVQNGGIARQSSLPSTPPSVLPDISPSRGEISRFRADAPPSTPTIGEVSAAGLISPLEGEMSGRTEGGAQERSAARVRRQGSVSSHQSITA